MGRNLLGLTRRGAAAHQPDDVAITGTVGGNCNSSRCVGNYRTARYTGLWSGVLEFTCQKCKQRSSISPGEPVLQPGALFYPEDPGLRRAVEPFKNDEDAEHSTHDYTDFNRKRGRAYGRNA